MRDKNFLIIKKNIVSYEKISWVYDIPKSFNIYVLNGQKVDDGVVLAQGWINSEVVDIKLTEYCEKDLPSLSKIFRKENGESVEKGDIILSGKVGGKVIEIKSPIDGIISLEKIKEGVVKILGPLVKKEVRAMYGGVVSFLKKKGLKIDGSCYVLHGVVGNFVNSSRDRSVYISGKWKFLNRVDGVTREEVEDKIVWFDRSVFVPELGKIYVLGARTVVVPSIIIEDWQDISLLAKKDWNWIALFGFGECFLQKPQIKELSRWNGEDIFINKEKKEIYFPYLPICKKVKKKNRLYNLQKFVKFLKIGDQVAIISSEGIELGNFIRFENEHTFRIEAGKKELSICNGTIFAV